MTTDEFLKVTGITCWAFWLIGVAFFTGYFGKEVYRRRRRPTAVEWLRAVALTLCWPAIAIALMLEEL